MLDAGRDDSTKQAVSERAKLDWGDITYLENEETTVVCANGRQLRIYSSPHSVRHGNLAFQYPRSQDVWAGSVPDGIDVLITHGPPRAHLDLLNLGCVHLLRGLWRVQPRLHVFGHAHEGAGTERLLFDGLQDAYERTVVSEGRLWNLLSTIREFVKAFFYPPVEARCLLVNPSMVAGLRDEQTEATHQSFHLTCCNTIHLSDSMNAVDKRVEQTSEPDTFSIFIYSLSLICINVDLK